MYTMNDRGNRPDLPRRSRHSAFAWVALVVSLNLILASCWFAWGDSMSGRGPDPTRTPTPAGSTAVATATVQPTGTPTPRPTNTPRPSPTTTATPSPTATPRPTQTPTPSPTPEPVVSVADLERILINGSDLPGSWTESSAINLGADSQNSICNVPGPDTVIEPVARAEAQLQQSDFGPFVLMNVSAYESEDEAEDIMDYLREAISCDVWEDESRGFDWEIRSLSFPDKGDDTFAIRLSTSMGFIGNIRLHAVFVQTDNVVTLIGNGALGSVDVDDTEDIVDLALDRVATLP
jgi:hypothetical protein